MPSRFWIDVDVLIAAATNAHWKSERTARRKLRRKWQRYRESLIRRILKIDPQFNPNYVKASHRIYFALNADSYREFNIGPEPLTF